MSLPGPVSSLDPARPRQPVCQRAVLGVLRAYQVARAGHVSPCRFVPSCSAYALEAVERHGALRGLWLAMRRVARCRPLGGHGVDLVPLESSARAGGR
ncbi:MAG: membrane protein insertion efficiency factor YidD [Acidimicrobiales bacterium]